MIIDYKDEIKHVVYFAYLNVLTDFAHKYGGEWLKTHRVTSENRRTLERLTESKALEEINDPAEAEHADPVVKSCDDIIRLVLLPKEIKDLFDELEHREDLII